MNHSENREVRTTTWEPFSPSPPPPPVVELRGLLFSRRDRVSPPASPERSSDLCHRGINFTSRGVLPGTPAMCESARCKIKRPSRKECLQFESIAVTALLHNTGLGHPHPIRTIIFRKVKERTNRKYTQQRGTLHSTHSEAEEFCLLCIVLSYLI